MIDKPEKERKDVRPQQSNKLLHYPLNITDS